ncbi:hypothetical protein GGR28_002333 [Lewinella aquimaris]|uniref:Knr4/Smi1-like domain-containing protein n=1 Tax=Neolewinella aquimaris TaxID=1835722 RepID=A0A840ECJ9_9BACT|nr:SMI1/KNR4 family protein [Neolewinella aquimaris]MBB4079708.1 hypothetical protein [Neolewinella aquimaris]
MKIKNSGPKLDKSAVDQLASRLNCRLPKAYVDFLLKHNGGTPEDDLVLDLNQDHWEEVILARFQVYYLSGEAYGIEQILENKGDLFPAGAVPCASDPGGNYFLILTRHGGGVYFWDHEHESQEKKKELTEYENLYFIAPDFDSFLDKLRQAA